jgi:uncharacterized membrane protein
MASKRPRTATSQKPARATPNGAIPARGNRNASGPAKTAARNTPGPARPASASASGPGDREPVAAPARAGRPAPRLWFQLTTLALTLIGLADAIYLTIAHFTTSTVLLCPANSFVNCGEVTSSPESEVFGVLPVAVLGLAFFVFLTAINSPWAWRWQTRQPLIHWARVGSMVVGMGFVLYLLYAELIQIGKLCEYCTVVHIITFILFIFIVFNATSTPEPTR